MDGLTIRLRQGNASFNQIIGTFVELNELYRMSQSLDLIKHTSELGFSEKPNNFDIITHEPLRRDYYVLLKIKPSSDHPYDLTLDGHIRKLNGAPSEGNSGLRHRCITTVREEGEKLIDKYGGDRKEELKKRYEREFESVVDKDYGLFEELMVEFFLKNLHLLKSPQHNPSK